MTGKPEGKPEWALALETKHGLPLDQIPGTVYVLCYDPPYLVQSVSADYAGTWPRHNKRGYLAAGPIRHYVGWTQQIDPRRRIANHHERGTPVTVSIVESRCTMRDEEQIKRQGVCRTCGGAYADSLTS